MYTLYDFLPSGNGYKVRLTLAHLGLAYRHVELDIRSGETRTREFLARNPNGRIPLLELPDGTYLSESHAICWYLVEEHGSDLLPRSPRERASVLEHLCFEQYNLEPNVAVVRFWLHELDKQPEELGEALVRKRELGHAALAVLEQRLEGRAFLVGERHTLADIGLYAYTHVAQEGGFELAGYPRIQAWLQRVAAVPGHVSITARPGSAYGAAH